MERAGSSLGVGGKARSEGKKGFLPGTWRKDEGEQPGHTDGHLCRSAGPEEVGVSQV